MLKQKISFEKQIDLVKENFPKPQKIIERLTKSIKYYENLLNTTNVVHLDDIALTIFMDIIDSKDVKDFSILEIIVSNLRKIYGAMIQCLLDKKRLYFLGLEVYIDEVDHLNEFAIKSSNQNSNLVELLSDSDINLDILKEFERIVSIEFSNNKTISFSDFFLIANRNSKAVIVNNPQAQVELSINETIRNKK
jgi:hypothetical protein